MNGDNSYEVKLMAQLRANGLIEVDLQDMLVNPFDCKIKLTEKGVERVKEVMAGLEDVDATLVVIGCVEVYRSKLFVGVESDKQK